MTEATNNATAKTADAKPRTVKKGDAVHVVKADGKTHLDAEVTAVRGGDKQLIDIRFRCGSDVEDTVITSAPFDETGKQPDSWHFPEPATDEKAQG
jgi:hypothetical protein